MENTKVNKIIQSENGLIINNLRIQILDKDLLRIERKYKGKFTDKNTFFIPDRNKFKGYEFSYITNDKNVEIYFSDYTLIVPFNDYKNIVLKNDKEVIYRFKNIKNSGELPRILKTPDVFSLNDKPHIFVPKEGYTANTNEEYKVEENIFDIYLMIVNKDHKLLRKMYVELTGKSDLVRFKTLGLWHSRYYKYTQEEAIKMINSWEEHDLPLDNFVIDTDWRKANDIGIGYEIDTVLFPDMKSVFDYAHSKNITVMFNDHPEPLHKVHNVFSKDEIKFRESNLQKILALGLDTWWYDRNWITKLISPTKGIEPETLGLYLFNDITKNHYLRKEGSNHTRPDIMGNVNNVLNGTYLKINDSASHRYPIQWTGDIACDRGSLSSEIINLINGSLNEVSYVHYDVGGHIGNPEKDVYLDWIKFATFTPVFRLHCTNSVKIFREPWNYDEETADVFKKYINIRYRLLGYLYSLCANNYFNGEPIFKSLIYNYNDDSRLAKIQNEYLFGNNILVAPNGEEIGTIVKEKYYKIPAKVQYFNNLNLEGEPVVTKSYPKIDFTWNRVSPEKNVNIYDFTAKLETVLEFDEDNDVYVRSDDGTRVYVDGKLMLDDWTYHGSCDNFVFKAKKGVAYNIKIEYLQGGGDACISLVSIRKKKEPRVILPNCNWIDAFNGKIYSGKNKPSRRKGLEDISLFIKEGSIIPLLKAKNNTSNMSYDDMIFECYPSKNTAEHAYFYEDDRLTVSYKNGNYRKTNYSGYYNLEDNSYIFNIDKTVGEYKDDIKERNILLKFFLLNGFKDIKEVSINGNKVEFELHKKDSNLFPFNEEKASNISDVININFKADINKSYLVKIKLK